MNRTLTQVVSLTQSAPRLLTRAKLVVAILAFCTAFLPVASANCRRNDRSGHPQNPASMPSGFTYAKTSHPSIVGLWNLTVYSGTDVVDVAFDAWTSDGLEVLNDFTDPIEGNVCLGVYEQTGPRTYKLKHPSWYFDTAGTLQGTVVINEVVHLSKDGNSFTGTYADDIYDVNGVFQVELTGTLSATRITPN